MRKNKNGVSPLIATVLIIGFTIALAAVVMTWGGGFVRSTTEGTSKQSDLTLKCSTELDFSITSAVKGTTSNKITVDNGGALAIKSMIFRIYDSTDSLKGVIDTSNSSQWVATQPKNIPGYSVVTFDVGTGTTGGNSACTCTGVCLPNCIKTLNDATYNKVEAIAVIDDGSGSSYTCGSAPRERELETV